MTYKPAVYIIRIRKQRTSNVAKMVKRTPLYNCSDSLTHLNEVGVKCLCVVEEDERLVTVSKAT